MRHKPRRRSPNVNRLGSVLLKNENTRILPSAICEVMAMRQSLFKVIHQGFMPVSMASLATFTVLITVQLIARTFNVQFYLADELLGIAFSLSVFFALPSITAHRQHLKVDFFLSSLSGVPRRILEFVIDLITVVYLAILSILITLLALDSYEIDARSQGMLSLPQFVPQFLIMIGLVASVLCLMAGRPTTNDSSPPDIEVM